MRIELEISDKQFASLEGIYDVHHDHPLIDNKSGLMTNARITIRKIGEAMNEAENRQKRS